MIQAENERILGIDLNAEYAQVSFWHASMREPATYTLPEGSQQLPAGLRQDENGLWHLWAGEPADEKTQSDRFRISGVFEKISRAEPVVDAGKEFAPEEILAAYLQQCMAGLKLLAEDTTLHVMITTARLTEELNRILVQALLRLGVDRKRIYVQDYLSSFYYYAVSQKKELWYQDVALLTYEDGAICGYVLQIDRKTKPAVARVHRVAEQRMDEQVRDGRSDGEWKREKDRLFFELLKKVFERRQVAVSYLMGDYFNKSWAERSIQFLCYHRHAYQGMNLYSKGSCYAALERAGVTPPREMVYGGRDMIDRNLSMEMCIRGKETLYPLVSAGVNWYEVHSVCEFIPRGEHELRVISSPMSSGETVVHAMRLPGLPPRPDRATRLRLTVYFSSPSCCHLEVEDLGFGGLYRSSGQSWSREIYL